MRNSPSRDLKTISTSTKKIKKFPTSPISEKEDNDKKYQTFKDDEKEKILNDLWKGVILIQKLPVDSPLTQDLLKFIDALGLDKYNALLRKVLERHVMSFKNEVKVLTQWRKKVKSWITNMGKPETRGGLVVAVDKQELFHQRVFEILNSIPYRCFTTLKNELLRVLEEFHNEQGTGKPFNPKTCSKHWWFNYMNKHQDIKNKWESIPLERTLNKGKKTKKSQTTSEVSSPDRRMQEEEHEEQVGFTTCESSPMGNSSLETSPIRESDQTMVFSDSDDDMQEEKFPGLPGLPGLPELPELPSINFNRFDSSFAPGTVDNNVDINRFFYDFDFKGLNNERYDEDAEKNEEFLSFPERF